MDKAATDKNKKVNEEPNPESLSFRARISPSRVQEFRTLTAQMDTEYQNYEVALNKASKSFFADKTHFEIIRRLENYEYAEQRNLLTIQYIIDYTEERLSNLEKIVQGITEKLELDMPSLKTQVDALQKAIKEPAFAEVHQFVQFVKQRFEEAKKAGEDYVE